MRIIKSLDTGVEKDPRETIGLILNWKNCCCKQFIDFTKATQLVTVTLELVPASAISCCSAFGFCESSAKPTFHDQQGKNG